MMSKEVKENTTSQTSLGRASIISLLFSICSLGLSALGFVLIVLGYTSVFLCSIYFVCWLVTWLVSFVYSQRTFRSSLDLGTKKSYRAAAYLGVVINTTNVVLVMTILLVFWMTMPKGY
jgi:predicted secreted protein